MPKKERTLALIKPDAIELGPEVVANILTRYLKPENGLTIESLKTFSMNEALFEDFYGEHRGKPFYEKLKNFSLSGPMMALIITGEGAVQKVRKINGPTNAAEAPKGTIRGDYGTGVNEPTNAVHSSASSEEAMGEISLIFE